jgi:hypothetical protein
MIIKEQYSQKGLNLQAILLMEEGKDMELLLLIMEHWKEILSMIRLMVKVNLSGKMVKFMKGSLKSLNFMALVKFYIQIKKLSKDNGDRIII